MGNENADNERKKHHRGRRRKKKGNIIANVILVIALIVFCVSGFQLFKIGKGYLDGRSEYDKVRKLAVTDDKNKNDKDKNHSEDGDDTFSVDFQKLLEINPDTIAWIRFPDEPSQINYPVVQRTDILFHYSLKDIILYALKVLYFIAFTYLTGTTLGKKAMNLRVVSKNPEEKLTLFNVVYRETVGRFLCSLPVNIGYIVAGIDSEKRGFHDLLCDTRVVYQKKIKAWMAQPGTVVPECEKTNVEEQKQQTSEGELSKTQENVQMKESGIRELKKTENTQSSVVEKLGKPVYNGYRLVENKSEKEIASNATVNENISEKDT